jgi:hypothetical protein
VAAIAVFVIYGVADLALKVINMLFMLRVVGGIRQDILVAIHTLNRYCVTVSVIGDLS